MQKRRLTNKSESQLEALMALHLRCAKLPEPRREYRFNPDRRWKFDFAWPLEGVALEIEGGTWSGGRHVTGDGFEKDCEKYNSAALMGWKVLRVTGNMVKDGRALLLVQMALSGPE